MFSNLEQMGKGDSIYVSDLAQNKLEYIVYDKYTVDESDLSCTNSSNKIEITLITCNSNNNNKRVVVKAKMKEWYHSFILYYHLFS